MYKIGPVTYIKLFENHIPYFASLCVYGSRNETYYFDEFCTENFLKKVCANALEVDNDLIQYVDLKEGLSLLGVAKVFVEVPLEKVFKQAKMDGAIVLSRLEGLKRARRIADGAILNDRQINEVKEFRAKGILW